MNYLLHILLIFVFSAYGIMISPAIAQLQWNELKLERANTAKDISYLSQEEKDIIFYTNLARIDGPLFAKTYLEEYLKKKNIRSNKWIVSLKKDLENSPSLIPLKPENDLFEVAEDHAKKSGKTGKTGHANFRERTKGVVKKYIGIGENCDYGSSNGLLIVMSLLIDENVPSLGHRKNMLNPEYYYTGVSIQRHKKYGFNGVILYGKKKHQEFSTLK